MIGLSVDPEFSEALPSQRNAPVQPQRPPPLPTPRLTTGLYLSSWTVSELLEPTGAGQQGPRSLPHPPGTDPEENPRGEGRAGTGLAVPRHRSSQSARSGAPGACELSVPAVVWVPGFWEGYGSLTENAWCVSQGPASCFLRQTLLVSQGIDQKGWSMTY